MHKLYGKIGGIDMAKTKVFTLGGRMLRNLFRKPATTQYPFVPVEYPEGMRGHVDIKVEDCIFCGLCQRACPSQAIKVDKNAGTWEISYFDCVQCKSCVDVCPKKCLSMGIKYTDPDVEKSNGKFEKPQSEESAPAGGKPVLDEEKCIYCTICAKKCPEGALEVDRKEKIWKLDEEKCIECGICAGACPKKALDLK